MPCRNVKKMKWFLNGPPPFTSVSAAYAQQPATDVDFSGPVMAKAAGGHRGPSADRSGRDVRSSGTQREVYRGTNGFTCMEEAAYARACMDANAMEWVHAWQGLSPADSIGMTTCPVTPERATPIRGRPTGTRHHYRDGAHVNEHRPLPSEGIVGWLSAHTRS